MNCKRSLCLLLCCLGITASSYAQIKTLDGRALKAEELDGFLQHQMEELQIPGLSIAVINNGQLVYKRALGVVNMDSGEKVNEQTLFEAASISKPVFTYFTLKMVEQGLLNLDTPLYQYLPYKDIEHDERYKLITARMVLTHTSGFPNWRFQNEDGKLDIKFTPGTGFMYSGEGYEYLAKVIAHLTGRSLQNLEELFREEVAIPLNMEHAYFTENAYMREHKAKGHEEGKVIQEFYEIKLDKLGAAHSLHTNATDFAPFLQALIREEGLKKETFGEMFSEQVMLPEDHDLRQDMGYDAWGLGIVRMQSPHGLLYIHGGMNSYFRAFFVIQKEKGFGFVFFANSDSGMELKEPLEQYLMGELTVAK